MIDLRRVERYARQLAFRSSHSGIDLLTGRHHSVFRGQGLMFAECREYQFGDDVRHVEWNATARLGRLFVRTCEEDRNATLLLLVDVSRSLAFGAPVSKRQLACELAALFALIGADSGEKVGTVLFSDRVERYVRPRTGRSHGWSIVRALARHTPHEAGTSLARACAEACRLMKKPGTIVIISDFIDVGYESALRALCRRNDVIALVPIAPREVSLPRVGLLHLRDIETGQTRWIDTSNVRTRLAHERRFRLVQRTRRELLARNGVPYAEISTDRPYLAPLLQFCRTRAPLD